MGKFLCVKSVVFFTLWQVMEIEMEKEIEMEIEIEMEMEIEIDGGS